MKRWLRLLIVAWLAVSSAFGVTRDDATADNWVALAELPREARETYALIKRGGPFLYERDGIVFKNFEQKLPLKPRGYYREYTVRSPWRSDRGPRRIVAGARGDFYYTSDHYRTFRRIRE